MRLYAVFLALLALTSQAKLSMVSIKSDHQLAKGKLAYKIEFSLQNLLLVHPNGALEANGSSHRGQSNDLSNHSNQPTASGSHQKYLDQRPFLH